MSAHTFKIGLDSLVEKSHEIVDNAIYNHKNGAQGDWNSEQEGGKTFWNLVSERGIVGTSGALRLKSRNSNDVCHVIAFGYWHVNNKPWFGAIADLDSGGTANSVLFKFYGSGKYNEEGVYWTQDNRNFKVTGRDSHEEISFISYEDFGTGSLNVTVSIRRSWD